VVNTPANPSGKVFTREELETVAEFAERYDLFVFTDEIYEHFIYDGRSHCSLASLPGMERRTITVSGFSKTFSVTGWRVGYALCDARWAQAIGYFSDLVYVCAPAPLQMGVSRGLKLLGEEYYSDLGHEYAAKRDRFCRALDEASLKAFIPQGAYYVLADASGVPGKTAREKAMHILRKTGVACVPGSAFYHDGGGEHLVRFCFAKEDHILDKACECLKKLHE
jgi:aminotransferase